ncbi:MAG: glutamine amidotransferase [Oscillospiraceae bacterium]|nr:glutamine amidotransferase [Oscillospiraceae bacterium]
MIIKILHLFPDLLNLYGDKGNIECLRKRLVWRGIDAEVASYTCEDGDFDLSDVDIVFIGGGSDREQKIVCNRLLEHKRELKDYVEDNGTLVAVCGGYQLLGRYYRLEGETISGLEILDIYTEQGKKRLIGNIVLESDFGKIVGFENHGGRTYIGNHKPLGRVLYGYGNDDDSGAEGVLYKNVVATYLHGPLFPKNPRLCDYVLTNALQRRYPDFTELSPLRDSLENTANEYIVKRFQK